MATGMDTGIEVISQHWTSRFHNHRQVLASEARGGPASPELTRDWLAMEVHRLTAPQLGAVVLYFQEFRAERPGLARRQRVVSLVVDPQTGVVATLKAEASSQCLQDDLLVGRTLIEGEKLCNDCGRWDAEP